MRSQKKGRHAGGAHISCGLECLFSASQVFYSIRPVLVPVLQVDNVGTVPAALSTYLAAQAFKPDIIISAGTAGGFKAMVGPRVDLGGMACRAWGYGQMDSIGSRPHVGEGRMFYCPSGWGLNAAQCPPQTTDT